MRVRTIGNYTIIKATSHKQIYSKSRMLQISKNKVYYVDLVNNKLLKTGERVLKWLQTTKK
jgi:hypothetical protein